MDLVISHPEKVLFPADGITKGELAAYYEAVAFAMVPHILARPITMERFPNGIGAKGFFHKDVSKGFPEWLERVEVDPDHRIWLDVNWTNNSRRTTSDHRVAATWTARVLFWVQQFVSLAGL